MRFGFLLLAFSLALSACGFSPMYGSYADKSVPAELSKVDIALIPDQSGVALRNILIDSFYQDGYPKNPAYTLEIPKVNESRSDLDITVESEATRRQLKLSAELSLREKATGKEVLKRVVRGITSYNVLGSQFTTRISEADAREAALADLARQIETQVALYLKKSAPQ